MPIFSNALREAQLRVNQGNIRSLRAVATNEILTRWNTGDDNSPHKRISTGADTDKAWIARAVCDKNGEFTDLKLYVVGSVTESRRALFDGISTNKLDSTSDYEIKNEAGVSANLVDSESVLDSISVGEEGTYYVQVYIQDIQRASQPVGS